LHECYLALQIAACLQFDCCLGFKKLLAIGGFETGRDMNNSQYEWYQHGRSGALTSYDEILLALLRVIRATDLHSKRLSKSSGLTAPQLLIMRTIWDLGQVTIGTIANTVSLSQATVTTILDRLELRNLVYRIRSTEDKRKVHAHLTEAGDEILARAPNPLQEDFIKKYQALAEWEQTMILTSLQRVANMMDADHIDASPTPDVSSVLREDG
jgi:DNA-binding MarR family transcriptional regulator